MAAILWVGSFGRKGQNALNAGRPPKTEYNIGRGMKNRINLILPKRKK